ncbi:hypothetical protein CDAR_384761 [Caerostris darwini]|uniref:Uncharacterized protein n=1 Tax=Caerostris darwini TaxID=1538125 RepID=A0AAV4WAU5_9ARAC|nr:hypothetical protein CDAR_384761 [Caerostris darwini]
MSPYPCPMKLFPGFRGKKKMFLSNTSSYQSIGCGGLLRFGNVSPSLSSVKNAMPSSSIIVIEFEETPRSIKAPEMKDAISFSLSVFETKVQVTNQINGVKTALFLRALERGKSYYMSAERWHRRD